MNFRFLLAAAVAAIPGIAAAQTTAPVTPPTSPPGSPPATTTAPPTPNAVTPPGGIARGVIAPDRPVDPGMVTAPPTQAAPTMPVIKPPGTAR